MELCEYAYYEPNETFMPQLLCHKFDKKDGKQKWMHLCLNQYCDSDMCWKNTKGSLNCEVRKSTPKSFRLSDLIEKLIESEGK